jgi:hypothetical protein
MRRAFFALHLQAATIFALQHRHQPQVEPCPVSVRGLPKRPFINKAQALVKMARASIVLVDVEKEPVGAELFERHPDDVSKYLPAQSPFGRSHDDSFHFDGAIVLPSPRRMTYASNAPESAFQTR